MLKTKLLSLEQNGRLADYNNYNINKTPVLILGMLTYHILGGLHQEEISILYRNNAANFQREINKDFEEKSLIAYQ
jgi:hypothetical protein